jgi:hypothetical protein
MARLARLMLMIKGASGTIVRSREELRTARTSDPRYRQQVEAIMQQSHR